MATAKVRLSGNWQTLNNVAWLPPRGPSGIWKPPLTPDYATQATYTANSFSALQAALNQCSGGEVIEITADLRGTSVVIAKATGTVPSASWTQNVLVRPPIGQRLNCDPVSIYCQHLTFAGFNFDTPGTYQITRNPSSNETATPTSSGSFSGFWRCVDTLDVNNTLSSVKWILSAGYHPFLYECAAPYYHPSALLDRINLYGNTRGGFATAIVAPIVKGCFFSGIKRDSSVDTSQVHVDNMQIESPDAANPTVFNPSVLHSVVDGGSGNAAIFTKNIEGDVNIYNNWIGYDDSDSANYSLGVTASVNQWGTTARTHISFSDFGRILPRIYSTNVNPPVLTYHMNRAAQNDLADENYAYYRGYLIKPDDGTNQFELSSIARPALADLTIVWPECPLSIIETAAP